MIIRCATCGAETSATGTDGKPQRRLGGWVYLDPPAQDDGKTNNVQIYVCENCIPQELIQVATAKRRTLKSRTSLRYKQIRREKLRVKKGNGKPKNLRVARPRGAS